jgi:hypothetical protein
MNCEFLVTPQQRLQRVQEILMETISAILERKTNSRATLTEILQELHSLSSDHSTLIPSASALETLLRHYPSRVSVIGDSWLYADKSVILVCTNYETACDLAMNRILNVSFSDRKNPSDDSVNIGNRLSKKRSIDGTVICPVNQGQSTAQMCPQPSGHSLYQRPEPLHQGPSTAQMCPAHTQSTVITPTNMNTLGSSGTHQTGFQGEHFSPAPPNEASDNHASIAPPNPGPSDSHDQMCPPPTGHSLHQRPEPLHQGPSTAQMCPAHTQSNAITPTFLNNTSGSSNIKHFSVAGNNIKTIGLGVTQYQSRSLRQVAVNYGSYLQSCKPSLMTGDMVIPRKPFALLQSNSQPGRKHRMNTISSHSERAGKRIILVYEEQELYYDF